MGEKKTKKKTPAAVVVVSIGDGICNHGQVIVVIDKGPVLEEQLDHVVVAPAGCHGQYTCAEPVASVDFSPVLQ